MKSQKFEDLLSKNPQNELFRFSLGQAYMNEDEPAKAIDAFDVCISRKSDWMMAYILKGKCQIAAGDHADAIPTLQTALELAIAQEHEAPEAETRKLLADLGADPS